MLLTEAFRKGSKEGSVGEGRGGMGGGSVRWWPRAPSACWSPLLQTFAHGLAADSAALKGPASGGQRSSRMPSRARTASGHLPEQARLPFSAAARPATPEHAALPAPPQACRLQKGSALHPPRDLWTWRPSLEAMVLSTSSLQGPHFFVRITDLQSFCVPKRCLLSGKNTPQVYEWLMS